MIGDGDGALLALRDKTAVVADESLGVALFIHDDSDFFSLFQIFTYRFIGQFGKMMIQFFGHIHEEDVLVGMGEVFVVHYLFFSFPYFSIAKNAGL